MVNLWAEANAAADDSGPTSGFGKPVGGFAPPPAIKGGGSSPSETDPNDPDSWRVWLGEKHVVGATKKSGPMIDPATGRPIGERDGHLAPRMRSKQYAYNAPFTWSEKKIKDAMQRMKKAGLQADTFDDMLSNWQSLVDKSAAFWHMSKKRVTPWDVLDMEKRTSPPSPSEQEQKQPRYSNRTSVSTHVNELSDAEAWHYMQQAANEALGREATHEEVRDYAYKASKIASENPDKVVTRQHVDNKTGDTETHTTSHPGANSADFEKLAQEEADTPEAGAYQAATTYYNALMSALDAVV